MTSERMVKIEEAVVAFEAGLLGTATEIVAGRLLAGPAVIQWTSAPGTDNLHFPMNAHTLLRLGFSGIAETAEENSRRHSGEDAAFLNAIARSYKAAMAFAAAHAEDASRCLTSPDTPRCPHMERIRDNCLAAATRAPESFAEAVQLFWFAWTIRRRGTVGRLDQYLYPFFRQDLETGRLTREEALELLIDLWEGFNRGGMGDTLRNVMLGGQNHDGRDATNDLSFLMVEAALTVRKPEPHLNARIHKNTPPEFLEKLADLQLLGHGQGTVFNDEVLIPSLVARGVPLVSARNYANDGCTEVVIDGESGISFIQLEAVKALELALFNGEENLPGKAIGRFLTKNHPLRELQTSLKLGHRSGDFAEMASFDQFYAAFLDQFMFQVDTQLGGLARQASPAAHACSSPFLAGTFPKCLESGRDLLNGGFTIPCFILFSGSIPTVADGLAAVKKVVFEDHHCTPAEMLQALRDDFVGHDTLRQHCLHAPKFGNDDDYVDLIAADIARRFCERVGQFPTPNGKPFWPAFFNFLFNDEAKKVGATPDGRKWKDPVCEHYSPTPGRAVKGATAVIRSAVKAPLGEACGTSVFHISLDRKSVSSERGREILLSLVQTALHEGAGVMNIAIYDRALLKDAQRHPDRHEDLIVRVWGFSAHFIDLSEDMQDHIISRTL